MDPTVVRMLTCDTEFPWLTQAEADYLRSFTQRIASRSLELEELEVDYARDLDDSLTFPEALAALETWKARREAC